MKFKLAVAVVALGIVLVGMTFTINMVIYSNSSNYSPGLDNRRISQMEYKFFVFNLKFYFEDKLNLTDASNEEKMAFWSSILPGTNQIAEEYLKQEALESVTNYKIQMIQSEDLILTNDEILKANEEIKKELANKRTIEVLKSCQMSQLDFEQVKLNLEKIKKLVEVEKSKIQLDDKTLEDYYTEIQNEFDRVIVQQILIKTGSDMDQSSLKQAEKKADDIYKSIKKGENIDKFINHSEDSELGQENGLVTVRRDDDNSLKNLIDWSFNNNIGTTGIIKTDLGFHICQIKDSYKDFTRLKNEVQEKYLEEEYLKVFNEYKKMDKYKINVDENMLLDIYFTKP